ncbi:MAG: hypothetical protein ACTSX6_07665 [Candidatus Heimdallarchaeaceae archaeon]
MKTLKGKIKLEFRNDIGLDIPEHLEFSLEPEEKYGYIYSTVVGRSSSVFASINEINREGEEIIIKLDKRIAGEIGDGDTAHIILSSSPPIAENVYLAIPQKLPLPQGDWSNIIGESNLGKTIDYGNKLSFVFPSEIREPFVVQGQVIHSIPYPPVIVSSGTKFHLVKADQFKLDELLSESLFRRKERAKELESSIRSGYYEEIIALKNNQLESLGRSLEFAAKPRVVYSALKTAYTSYTVMQDKVVMEEETAFAANLMYVTTQNEKNRQIVEIIITGRENDGLAAIWVYGEDMNKMKTLMVKEILPKAKQLIEGVKEGPELVQMYCAGNCGELLRIEDMDEKGIIKCPACETINFIPSRLRVH